MVYKRERERERERYIVFILSSIDTPIPISVAAANLPVVFIVVTTRGVFAGYYDIFINSCVRRVLIQYKYLYRSQVWNTNTFVWCRV